MANILKRFLVFLVIISLFAMCGCKNAVNNSSNTDTTVNGNVPSAPNADSSNPSTSNPNGSGTLPENGFEGPIDVFEDEDDVTEPDGTEGTEQPADPTEPTTPSEPSNPTNPTNPTDPTEPTSDPTVPGETVPENTKPGNQGGNTGGPIELPMIPG